MSDEHPTVPTLAPTKSAVYSSLHVVRGHTHYYSLIKIYFMMPGAQVLVVPSPAIYATDTGIQVGECCNRGKSGRALFGDYVIE